jgi:hypothetical protein
VGFFTGENKETEARIVLGTYESVLGDITSKEPRLKSTFFDAVIFLDAQTATTSTYVPVLRYFEGFRLGVTECVTREEEAVYQWFGGDVTYGLSVDEAYERGFTRKREYLVYVNPADESGGLVTQEGAFPLEAIDNWVHAPEITTATIEAIIEQIVTLDDCKAIVYCRSIAHVKEVEALFEGLLPSKSIYSALGERDIRSKIESYQQEKSSVLIVFNLLNERTIPIRPNLVVFWRPTVSPHLTVRQLWPLFEDSDKLVVMDFSKRYKHLDIVEEQGEGPKKATIAHPPQEPQHHEDVTVHLLEPFKYKTMLYDEMQKPKRQRRQKPLQPAKEKIVTMQRYNVPMFVTDEGESGDFWLYHFVMYPTLAPEELERLQVQLDKSPAEATAFFLASIKYSESDGGDIVAFGWAFGDPAVVEIETQTFIDIIQSVVPAPIAVDEGYGLDEASRDLELLLENVSALPAEDKRRSFIRPLRYTHEGIAVLKRPRAFLRTWAGKAQAIIRVNLTGHRSVVDEGLQILIALPRQGVQAHAWSHNATSIIIEAGQFDSLVNRINNTLKAHGFVCDEEFLGDEEAFTIAAQTYEELETSADANATQRAQATIRARQFRILANVSAQGSKVQLLYWAGRRMGLLEVTLLVPIPEQDELIKLIMTAAETVIPASTHGKGNDPQGNRLAFIVATHVLDRLRKQIANNLERERVAVFQSPFPSLQDALKVKQEQMRLALQSASVEESQAILAEILSPDL